MKILIITFISLLFFTACDQVAELKTNSEGLIQQTLEQAEQTLEETKNKVKQIKEVLQEPKEKAETAVTENSEAPESPEARSISEEDNKIEESTELEE